MLTFFSKTYYLRDLLNGFVDIHNHILPGIDDGAKTIEDSINLIKQLKALGVKQFIPTPHIMQDFYPNTDETIGNAYESLLGALDSKLLSEITINPSAEYMMDHNFEHLLESQNIYPLKSNYVLVEMSYFQAPINLEEIIFKIKTKGYLPVLAHPERYSFYHGANKDYYNRLKKLGCLFQLNLLSLSEHYGKRVEKIASYLLEENLIDFVGSDVHNENHIKKLSAIALNKKYYNKLNKIIKQTNLKFSVTQL